MNYREVLLRLIAYTTPYVYDNNISLLELTRKLYKIVNELCQAMKEMSDEMDGIKETITDTTRTVLLEMKDDGTLAEIINETLFNELNERLNLLSQSVLSLSERVTTNETNIETLTQRISSDEQEIERIDQKIDSEMEKLNISYSDEENVVLNKSVYADDFKCKNLLDQNIQTQTINGITITRNSDGSLKLYGIATANINISSSISLTLPAGTYTHSIKNNAPSGLYLSLGNISDTMIGLSSKPEQTTFSISQSKTYSNYIMSIDSGTTINNLTVYPQIEVGDTATNYTSYKDFIPSLPKLVRSLTTTSEFTFSFTDENATNNCYLIVGSKGSGDGTFGGIWFIRRGASATSRVAQTGTSTNVDINSTINGNTITCTFSGVANYMNINIYRV